MDEQQQGQNQFVSWPDPETKEMPAIPVHPFVPSSQPFIPHAVQQQLLNPMFAQNMLAEIKAVDEYCWSRGEMGGMDWGFECFNEAFEGLNTGVHLFAGQSNIGKSGLCMQLAWQIAYANRTPTPRNPRKAHVIYFSLDDSNNELMPRMVSISQKIPINVSRYPVKNQDNKSYMDKRAKGFQELRESVMNLSMMDSNKGTSIEFIEQQTLEISKELEQIDPAYNIVLVIDNFHDITVEAQGYSDNNKRYDHISDQLSRIAQRFDAPIICTAEFRKLNGNRRPKIEDIRESVKIQYEAKAIILCYNEVSLRGPNAQIAWELQKQSGEVEKMPIYECQVAKNKYSSFKGWEFFRFTPWLSTFTEVDKETARRYTMSITG